MIDQLRQKHRRRRLYGSSGDSIGVDGDSNSNNGIRLRSSSVTVNRSNTVDVDGARKMSLVLFCVYVISNQISSEVYTASAFSMFRPESMASTVPSSSTGPKPSPTARFLFSFRNDNNGEDSTTNNNDDDASKDEGATATIERAAGWSADDESENFSAWMEGLKLGTPLGKLASSSQATLSEEDDSESVGTSDSATTTTTTTTSPLTKKGVSSVSLRDSKSKTDSSSSTSTSSTIIDNTGRRKINPLSNLIQFEAMLELAKIAGNKDTNEKDVIGLEASSSNDSSSAKDVFAVVDRLVKTFQKQEEKQQRGRKELLQLAQLEEKIIAEDKLIKDTNDSKGDSVGVTTTVSDLMELDLYVGGLLFPKVSNIWETFSGKDDSVATADDDRSVSNDDTKIDDVDKDSIPSFQSSTGPASSSPLFREKEPNGAEITSSSTTLAQAAESILKDTTKKMEYLVAEASIAILEPSDDGSSDSSAGTSTSAMQDLVGRASSVFNNTAISPTTATATTTTTTGKLVESISNDIVAAAQKIAKESGVEINVQFAADRAREATEYAVGVAATANMVLDVGYAYGSRSGVVGMEGDINDIAASAAIQTVGAVSSSSGDASVSEGKTTEAPARQSPLFGDFASAQRIEPYEYDNVVHQSAEMGSLAGAIYDDPAVQCLEMGHSLVANGTAANVAWMVTDTVMDRKRYTSAFCHHDDAIPQTEDDFEDTSSGPVMVRTITMRGFDASDESVDREALLSEICFATGESMDDATADRVVFHKGLLNIARQMYADVKQYIDWTSPNHKIVFNGHSVGGSLAVLMLLLITSERGVDYVRDRIPRVYSYGAPPVATLADNNIAKSSADDKFSGTQRCPILEAFDLPPSMIYGFIQPYDPVVRLFSNHDVLYPLVDDLGKDGITLYSTGPIRSLRPMTRAIFQAWDGWPQFRDNWKGTCDTQYQSIGIQHMMLPEPLRYLNDRFISVNVGVPPVHAIVRISPEDLLPALDLTFPLDTFKVSLVPQAVRSFLHHFYPAYAAISDYAAKIKDEEEVDAEKKSGAFKPFQTTQS